MKYLTLSIIIAVTTNLTNPAFALPRENALPILSPEVLETSEQAAQAKFREAIEIEDAARFILDIDPLHVCGMVTSPGDFLLQKLTSSDDDLAFREKHSFNLAAKNLLSLNDLSKMKYGHAEMISAIDGLDDIQTVSYYPKMFRNKPDVSKEQFERYNTVTPGYRDDFATFRLKKPKAKGLGKKRAKALEKIANPENYGDQGLCSDFINWANDQFITSWWNVLPLLRQGLASLYPPEAISSPDNLAKSPFTKKVCEVESGRNEYYLKTIELVEPQTVCVAEFKKNIEANRGSGNASLEAHADKVEKRLEELGVILNGEPTVNKLYFVKNPSSEARAKKCRP